MLKRLKKRQEFLGVAASGGKVVTRSMVLQYRKQPESPAPCCHVGFTVTKRQGNSVVRNRIRRRLREAFRLVCEKQPMPGWDFVVIGRHTAERCEFDIILQDMGYALKRIGREQNGKPAHA